MLIRSAEPARNARPILLPLFAVRTREKRFLCEHHSEMKQDRDGHGVNNQAHSPKHCGPTNQDGDNSDIHGISAESIQADSHQSLGRRPRRERASTSDIEIPYTPQQQCGTNRDRNHANPMERRSLRGTKDESRDDKSNNAGQCEKREYGLPEQFVHRSVAVIA